jgi:polar amino acid transport system ATP-binding protein
VSLVEIKDVHKSFGELEVLKGVSLSVEEGEVVSLIGRSGSGKTTLLRCVNHLESLDAGSITVNGVPVGYSEQRDGLHELPERLVARNRRRIGIVFQHFNLFPHMSVLENIIEAPVRVLKTPRREARKTAMSLLERVGLADKAAQYPASLSGGQQQRVAIARALAMSPQLMLFDEPTSALDPELVAEVLDVVRDLAHDGMTMIIVTHELRFASEVSDRIVFMHEGAVAESGPPANLFAHPECEPLRAFLARSAFAN